MSIIVDLLPELNIVLFPPNIPVIGKFSQDTRHLSYEGVRQRVISIIMEVRKLTLSPSPMTFYIQENWQSFAVSRGVAAYFFEVPRVLVVNWRGEIIDLSEFEQPGFRDDHFAEKEVMKLNHRGDGEKSPNVDTKLTL